MASESAKSFRVDLGDVLDVARCAAKCAQLKEALTESATISLDASNLSQVDAAGVQLLAAFVQAARHEGCVVQWNHPTNALHTAIRLLGLNDFFGLGSAAVAQARR